MSNPLTRTLNLSINLSLCSSGHSRSTRLDRSQTTNTTISSDDTTETTTILEENKPSKQRPLSAQNFTIPPPTWAVSARGESRLEPISETALLHSSIDLTTKPFYCVGRSEDCDIILLHPNSSRQHALVFHDPYGSCFVADCGSAEGTFVNALKLPQPRGSESLYPLRVKCGSLIRFGGPGCPTFILKSFSHGLESFVKTLNLTSDQVEPNYDSGLSENIKATQPSIQNLLPKCGDDDPSPVAAAQLKLNTRINASGSVSSTVTSPTMLSLRKSDSKTLRDDQNTSTTSTSFQLRKRPLSEEDVRQMCSKETRGLHTPLCSELFNRYDTNAALFHEMTTDCVSQSVTLTPCLESKDTQQKLSDGLYLSRTLLTDEKKACTLSNEEHSAITESKKRSKRVTFSNEIPSFIYPLTITPDE